ncbi:MAG: toxin-antitoxin system HicB family antitoxin [Proteiniphilum sp.]|jgi:predicted HicB family RNase H-like nuclease
MLSNNLQYYKSINYNVIVKREELDGEVWFTAYCAELGIDACHGKGNTEMEAIDSFKVEKDSFIEYLYEMEIDIPEPENTDLSSYSGVFTVRTTPWLHYKLANQSKAQDVSLNQYINQILSYNLGSDESFNHAISILNELKENINKPIEELLERTNSLIYDKDELSKSKNIRGCLEYSIAS